jgi:hypothetical protein
MTVAAICRLPTASKAAGNDSNDELLAGAGENWFGWGDFQSPVSPIRPDEAK